ncbi:fungal-specific transcription factor domain-containing protein [Zychaea mexicana]|uniref:fungal-specific transcription factor domain-containing protein n=1 Tax=Zychaea mexicana TaxID=64656 RepID=UPI0022FDDAB2|nr:fungal-specific transcription factor domain-containing protein [Zychaea mexicana]KAI9487962.1 fungal-specific transcription factor domain-containing protein [Zychaea mexicana]
MEHDSDAEHLRHENGKKRVRATQACVLCRKKKIKCDGTKPECLHCQEANTQCEYTESKKRGPRKGYVQLLEERLAQMERRLVRLGGTAALLSESSGEESPLPMRSMLPSQPSYTRDPVQRIAEENEGLPSKEVIMHLVDLFFKYINSVFPFVHKATLKQSVEDGTVSKPLLWSVLAIGARYSDDPSIKTDPPYWAGERFAAKATSLIDASMLEPTLPNLQFWGIMACLEYGRASGSKAWIYTGLAVRFCQELGLNKEETLSTPILSKDGTIDTVAMSLRRRIFWSCYGIDKFTSAGTNRPQSITKSEVDAHPPSIPESMVLRDSDSNISATNKRIANDSLMDISRHYMKIMEIFGEVNTVMSRSKSDSTSIQWPPVPEYAGLDTRLRLWKDNLPERFQFTPKNLDFHKDSAGFTYFNIWLSIHAVWCSSLMVLHRGSLAYGDIRPGDVDPDVYRAIQASIDTCKTSVRTGTGVFRSMRDLCGYNVLPFMGYSAYVFATVLMTSTFSKGPDACRKSSNALKILYDLIDVGFLLLFRLKRELNKNAKRSHLDIIRD